MGGFWGELHLLLSAPLLLSHHHHCTHTSSWEIGRLCFLSGCPRPQTRGAFRLVGIWSSLSKDTSLFPPHQKENKTRGWHSSSAILSHIVFASSPTPTSTFLLLFLLPRRSIVLIGSRRHWCIDCSH